MPFTHVAAHHARIASVNALFGLRRRVDYRAVPRVVFTDPEIAAVGLAEAEARDRWGERAQVVDYDHADLDRAITAGRTAGFAKLIGDRRGRLVGATIAGTAAGETIAELSARVAAGDGIGSVSTAVHAYPTFTEAAARAADEHQRAGATPRARARAPTRPVLALLRRLDRPDRRSSPRLLDEAIDVLRRVHRKDPLGLRNHPDHRSLDSSFGSSGSLRRLRRVPSSTSALIPAGGRTKRRS